MDDKKSMEPSFINQAKEGFASRLEELIGEESIRQFSTRVRTTDTTLRKYLAGAEPKLSNLVDLAQATGVSIEWLATGCGAKYPHAQTAVQQEAVIPPEGMSAGDFSEEYALIDGFHAEVSTGHGCTWLDVPVRRKLAFRKKWLKFRGFNAEKLKVVFAKGDSMEPTIHSGDSILVDTSITQVSDGSVFVLGLGGDLYAKRLQKRFDGGINIISDNREYQEQVVTSDELEQLQIIGQVVWVGKDIK